MTEDSWMATDAGKNLTIGIVQSLCYGFTIEQAADLNNTTADAAKIMLAVLLSDAEYIPPFTESRLEE